MVVVVYISFLIPSGYLKYVDNSVQLFLHEFTHVGYFLPHFSSNISRLFGISFSVDALYTVF